MSRYLKNEYNWAKEISDDVSLHATRIEKIQKEFNTTTLLFGKGKVSTKACRRETWEPEAE